MAETESIVGDLVRQTRRVERLPAPERRALMWLIIAIPFVALFSLSMGLREDLAQKFTEARYLVEQSAALATAIVAAFAAFWAVVPSAPRWILFAPLIPLSVWLGSLGLGSIQDWVTAGPAGVSFSPDWFCLPGIAAVGSLPAVVMAIMLRGGVPMFPHLGVALGGLAAAGIGNFGLRLFHVEDASIMVLVWQLGTVALLVVLAGCLGPRIHSWHHVQ